MMQLDPNNIIVELCAEGMRLEGQGKNEAAFKVFMQAWEKASSYLEKFTAAHYVARHQATIRDKLKWDETALDFAMRIDEQYVKEAYPSLYLNIAKAYEDLQQLYKAKQYYQIALSYTSFLLDDEYAGVIQGGIDAGLLRLQTIGMD